MARGYGGDNGHTIVRRAKPTIDFPQTPVATVENAETAPQSAEQAFDSLFPEQTNTTTPNYNNKRTNHSLTSDTGAVMQWDDDLCRLVCIKPATPAPQAYADSSQPSSTTASPIGKRAVSFANDESFDDHNDVPSFRSSSKAEGLDDDDEFANSAITTVSSPTFPAPPHQQATKKRSRPSRGYAGVAKSAKSRYSAPATVASRSFIALADSEEPLPTHTAAPQPAKTKRNVKPLPSPIATEASAASSDSEDEFVSRKLVIAPKKKPVRRTKTSRAKSKPAPFPTEFSFDHSDTESLDATSPVAEETVDVFAATPSSNMRKTPARGATTTPANVSFDSDSSPLSAARASLDSDDDIFAAGRMWKSNAGEELELDVSIVAVCLKKGAKKGVKTVTPSTRKVKKEGAKKKRVKQQSTLAAGFQINGNASLDQARLYFAKLDGEDLNVSA